MAAKKADTASDSGRSRVLYRKYRPTKLEDVVGQEQITQVLANSLKRGKIAHAYLFIGPRGTGKTSIARIFAHAINGFDYQIEDNYLDIVEIDAASNTGVDNIREIREKAVIAPTKGKYKVYIIDEVHMLTKSASNALLKTLEEPPEHVIFIMATTDAHKVPITISSRTQVHTFRLADPETMFSHLRKISDLEKIPITDDALKIVVRRGGGSFRDSLSLLDQVMNLAESSGSNAKGAKTTEITAEMLNSALGLPEEQVMSELLEAYETQDIAKIHELLQNLLNSGTKPEIIASECIEQIMSSPRPGLLSLLAALPEVQPPFPEAKLLLAFLGPSQKRPELYPTSTPKAARTSVNSPRSESATPKAPEEAPKNVVKTTPKSEPEVAPETVAEPVVKPKPAVAEPEPEPKAPEAVPKATSAPSGDFDWQSFIARVREASAGVANQLQHTDYDFDGQTLHLYPSNKIIQKIFDKPENSKILSENLPGIKLTVHAPGDRLAGDGTISQISAIMGGVQEVRKDEMPF